MSNVNEKSEANRNFDEDQDGKRIGDPEKAIERTKELLRRIFKSSVSQAFGAVDLGFSL